MENSSKLIYKFKKDFKTPKKFRPDGTRHLQAIPTWVLIKDFLEILYDRVSKDPKIPTYRRPNSKTFYVTSVSYTHLTLPTIYSV